MKTINGLRLAVAATLVMACSDSTGLDLQDLVGTWNAQSYSFVDQATGTMSVDLIATQGASFTLVVTEDGSASTAFNDGQGGSSSDSGQFSSDGQNLTLAGETFAATRSGNTLTLVDATSEYDFDGDGSDDLGTLTIILQR